MNGDLGHWPGSSSDLYSQLAHDISYAEPGNAEFDMYHSPLPTDPADVADFVQSIPTKLLHTAAYSDTVYAQNLFHLSPGHASTSQRQSASQPLHINTQLGPNQTDEPESSTASSSSFGQLLQTPYSQLYTNFQPPIYIPSPQSASADCRILITDLEKMPSLPVSPSLTIEGEMFDAPISPLPIEADDVVTHSPMSHILEWKRVIELCGTNDFVPQTVYQPYTEADKKRYIRDVELQETIFFGLNHSSELGVSLDDVLKQRLLHLKDKDDPMFVGCGPSVSIRIQWPGYHSWSKQIPTMDFRTPKGPITRAKLAKNIATCIRRFAESVQDKPMEAESDRRWKVGKRHIRVEDLILVSLHHVSKGSWQPQLRLRRSFTTFPYHWDGFLPQSAAL